MTSFNFIGSRFGEAFQEPASFVATRPLFEVLSCSLHRVLSSMEYIVVLSKISMRGSDMHTVTG